MISAILNLGQNVTEDWPLFVRDHTGEDHLVTLAPGHMVWYESASVVHSRQWPLNGHSYDNLFVHFKPRGKTWYGVKLLEIPYAKELHKSEHVPPVSLELIKQEQENLLEKKTDWTDYDYNMLQKNYFSR